MEGGDAKDGDRTALKDCEVQDGQVVEWGSKSPTLFMHLNGQIRMLTTL